MEDNLTLYSVKLREKLFHSTTKVSWKTKEPSFYAISKLPISLKFPKDKMATV